MTRQLSAVAWDIDGTLIDSEPLHHQALIVACDSFGCDLTDLPAETYRGVHMEDVWLDLRQRLPEGLRQSEWLATINRHYIAHRAELLEIAGARAAMETLHGLGVRQVCVSNSSRMIVDANLDALGIAELIEFSISIDDVRQGKPSPEPYLQAVRRLGLPPERIVAVEDSTPGFEAAKQAGLIAVRFGASDAFPEGVNVIRELAEIVRLFASRPHSAEADGPSHGR